MTDRSYRTLLGVIILFGLYFEHFWLIYALITLLMLEGISNMRVPVLLYRLRGRLQPDKGYVYENTGEIQEPRFQVDAERIWRLVVGSFLYVGYVQVDALWFFPWFMGFAIFGAGLSGVCPVLLAIRWLGFR